MRVEKRLDESIAVRHGERYLKVKLCKAVEKAKVAPAVKLATARGGSKRGTEWGKNFDLKKGPKVWQVT